MTAHADLATSPDDPIVTSARIWARSIGANAPKDADLSSVFAAAHTISASPGLDFAAWLGPASIGGVVGPLLANSPTPAWLLQRLAQFHPLIGSESLTYASHAWRNLGDLGTG
ncbi:MAG TPA: hypothetical protein VN108_02345 [Marmoricola sp.]|nr:hypothetical protein [Marmoricola sp.]